MWFSAIYNGQEVTVIYKKACGAWQVYSTGRHGRLLGALVCSEGHRLTLDPRGPREKRLLYVAVGRTAANVVLEQHRLMRIGLSHDGTGSLLKLDVPPEVESRLCRAA